MVVLLEWLETDAVRSLARAGVVALILIVGFLGMKLLGRMLLKLRRADSGLGKSFAITLAERLFFMLALVAALVYLGFTSIENFALQLVDLLPTILLVLLLVILGALIVQVVIDIVERLVDYARIEEVLPEELGRTLLPLLLFGFRILLYVILLKAVLSVVDLPELNRFVDLLLYPLLILFMLVLFVIALNPARDVAAAIYLKHVWAFVVGNTISMDGSKYTIRRAGWLAAHLERKDDGVLVVPNHVLASKPLEFERPSRELRTLEALKDQFVAQLPSMCGPASAQIALSIFRIKSDQRELARLADSIQRVTDDQVAGTHPDKLIKAIERFTRKRVRGAWVDADHIYNLRQELETWLREGALVIVDYKKRYLFPEAKRAHYSLVVGVRGDELLIIDPSRKAGGVYFADHRDVFVGMDTHSELIGGKRGYIVLARRGSAAYSRVEEGLIYHHPSMYDRLSKALELRLSKLTSGPALADTLPRFVRTNLRTLEKEQVRRVWRP